MRLAITCVPGLEAIVLREAAAILSLPERGFEAHRGFVSLRDGDALDERSRVYRLSLLHGSASAVALRAKRFSAQSFKQLVRGVSRVDFRGWLGAGQSLELRVESTKSRLYHTEGIRDRVAEGLTQALGGPPNIIDMRPARTGTNPGGADSAQPQARDQQPPEGPARLLVRLRHDSCTLALDPGPTLHRRGYRLATAKAPLRPDYANALLQCAGYDGTTRFGDPLCGSGTLAIEAARITLGIAPGSGRRFAFQDSPGFDQGLFDVALGAGARMRPDSLPAIWGSDRDAGAIDAARSNAERAGVSTAVRFRVSPLSDSPIFTEAELATTVVCNPPYGERIARGKSLKPLYQRLGALVSQLPAGSRAAMIAKDETLVRATGLGLAPVARFKQGGLPVAFYA